MKWLVKLADWILSVHYAKYREKFDAVYAVNEGSIRRQMAIGDAMALCRGSSNLKHYALTFATRKGYTTVAASVEGDADLEKSILWHLRSSGFRWNLINVLEVSRDGFIEIQRMTDAKFQAEL